MNTLTAPNRADAIGDYMPFRDEPYYREPVGNTQHVGLHDLLRVIRRYRMLMLFVVAPVTLATLLWQLSSPSLYRSSASAKVELIDDVGVNQAEVLARNSQRIANEVKLHRSRSAAERVVRDLELHKDPAFIKEMGAVPEGPEQMAIRAATSKVLDMVTVQADEGSDQIEIAVTSRSPELAARIANQIPASVRTLKSKNALARRAELLVSLQAEQRRREEAAANAAERVAEFRQQHGLLVGAGGGEDLAQVNRIAVEAASAAGLRAGSAAQSAGVGRAAAMRSMAGATSPVVQHLQSQEADISAEIARLSQTYGSRHPDILRLNGQLSDVQRSLAKEQSRVAAAAAAVAAAEDARMAQLARSEAARDAARAGQLEGILSGITRKAYENTKNSVELDRLTGDSQLAAKAYHDITERIAAVRAQMEMEGVTSTLVSPAVVNYEPVSPSPVKTTVLAFLGSGIIALLLAFTRELLDDKLRTVAQIRRFFGLPTFGMLPLIRSGMGRNLQESPVLQDPQSLFAEVARATYSEVQALAHNGSTQSVLITSPLPGEGKSVVALSLAAAAVALGKRAVVLDLDLRKVGILQQIQQGMNSPDLLEVLKGNVDLRLIAPDRPDEPANDRDLASEEIDLSRIALLSVRKPVAEPAAILGSRSLQILIEDLKSRFDFIVVNAPPTLAVRDAVTMCDFTDHTLVIARWGTTTINQMQATLEMLGHGRVAGVVFSHVDYAEHARRVYGDSIQYYFESSAYYSDMAPVRVSLLDELKRLFSRRPQAA